MSVSWQRWLAYAKAKLDSRLKESEADLDEREARLRVEAEGKPWLSSSSESPTFDEMRARIEHDAREAAERQRRQPPGGAPAPSRPGPRVEGGLTDAPPVAGPPGGGGPGPAPAAGVSTGTGEDPLASFDMAAHQKAADERLAAIRRELGLADASETDASETDDAGTDDAGTDDAGTDDAGTDATETDEAGSNGPPSAPPAGPSTAPDPPSRSDDGNDEPEDDTPVAPV